MICQLVWRLSEVKVATTTTMVLFSSHGVIDPVQTKTLLRMQQISQTLNFEFYSFKHLISLQAIGTLGWVDATLFIQ